MKTMAPETPSSHIIAPCRLAVARAAGSAGKARSAAAVYVIKPQPNATQQTGATGRQHNSVRVLVPRQQRDRRFEQNVEVEQHRPVLDIVQVELDALLDLLFVVDLA